MRGDCLDDDYDRFDRFEAAERRRDAEDEADERAALRGDRWGRDEEERDTMHLDIGRGLRRGR